MRGSASARRGARGPGSAGGGRAGWRRAPARVTWRGRASGGRRRAVLTLAAGPQRAQRSAAEPARPGAAAPWWPSSASAWPTRSTARTSPSAATSPRPRGRPRRRRRRWGRGCWRCSSSWCVDQPSSRSSRASGWACEAAPRAPRPTAPRARPAPDPLQEDARRQPCLIPGPLTSHSEFSSPCRSALKSTTCIKQ